MDFLETKVDLITKYGHLQAVQGIGVLKRNVFGIFLQKGFEVDDVPAPEEYEDFSVEIVTFDQAQVRLEKLKASYEEHKKKAKH